MNNLTIGSYVIYNDTPHLVVAGAGRVVTIVTPATRPFKVDLSYVFETKFRPAVRVVFKHSYYLVTSRNLIVSCTTGKVMKWGSTHSIRKALIHKAEVSRTSNL